MQELAESRARAQGIEVEQALAQFTREIPLGRLGRPEEFAAVVVFLASERAGYITGVTLPVDGGVIRASW